MEKNQDFKTILGMFNQNYTVPKEIFSLNSDTDTNSQNFGTLFRKGMAADLAGKPRVK